MFRSPPLPVCLLAVLSALTSAVVADDYKPNIAAASNDAKLALQGFVIPEGMTGSLLASEPALANPVAFYVASDGRVYVCETFRQEVGVEDNRSHMDWLNNDLQLETVEERLAMFKRYLGDDVAKYATQHDRIRVLRDTNNDGTFDDDKVFAEGFNDILDGTGAGVIEHDGKVYYTCIPKLWMLEDTDNDGVADRTDALHHGYGVRVAFRGHDMHGLTVGPDGRLYFSIGDRGYNVITKEGTRLKKVDSGAVFRCDVDGTHLEVFAEGLRNPQELTFDNYGNLWTGDNNSDGGDKARWVYIVQNGDTGWRMYFQYLDDRGPWNRERMWHPYRADIETTAVQPAYIVPPIANLGDGPSGLTYYPGLGLADRYENHFFMADFRGAAGNSGIRSFSVKPKGATFELTDSHEFLWSILGTDVDFAPDGSLYVTDWVNGWVGEGKGRLYRFSDNEHISAVAGANVPTLLNGGVAVAKTTDLVELLGHADRRVRQAAQFQLVKNGDRKELYVAATSTADEFTPLHATWGLWQLGLKSVEDTKLVAQHCLTSPAADAEVHVQQIRVLTDLVSRHGIAAVLDGQMHTTARESLTKITSDDDLRAAGFAAVALGAIGESSDLIALLDLLQRNDNADPVIRHQAVMGLTSLEERSPGILVTEQTLKRPVAVRLAMTVALRRLRRDDIGQMLGDEDSTVVAEAARAITEQGTDTALDALSARLAVAATGPKGISEPATVRRALEAGYRLGGKRHAELVAGVAADEFRPDNIRLIAANMLKTWNDPQQTDTVTGRYRTLPKRNVEGLKASIQSNLAGMLAGPSDVRQATIEVAAQLGIKDVVPALKETLDDEDTSENLRVAAFRALAKLSDDVDGLLEAGRRDPSEAIQIASLQLLSERHPEQAVLALAEVIEAGSVKGQQTAFALLGQIQGESAQAVVEAAFEKFAAGELSPAVSLDVLKAAEVVGSVELTERVRLYRVNQQPGDTLEQWSDCLEGGDAGRGYVIFFGRAAASCRRCHKVNGDGADVGPDLSAVSKDKDRSYLLEAIVDPSAKIAKGFETTIIVDVDGKVHSGIIKEETDKLVKLMNPKGAIITVATEDIDERAKGLSGMPADIAKNLSRDEIRDLVEYMSTLKTAKEDGAHGEEK